ncbi:MAG: hypothetical protein A2Y77_02450 [Planctomycetes bacterium RBG_13_62_9]|nr:MAG: hypothetical protein A2Y77_02450 [Planctomycetes bacterium RBG_13_62_9]
MDQVNDTQNRPIQSSRKLVPTAVAVCLAIAVASFIVIAILPAAAKPFFDSPLRSFLMGLGLAGVACPLCIAGSLLRRRAARSPYFEEGFMAAVLNVFGYVCAMLAVLCLGLAAYALLHRVFAPVQTPAPLLLQ